MLRTDLCMSKTPRLAASIAVAAFFRCNRHPRLRIDGCCTRKVVADVLQRALRARSLITDPMNSPAFSLQRDSTNQAVNWDAVDDELDKIPSELKDPRFDSLRHVLNILSAVDAEAALEEVHL